MTSNPSSRTPSPAQDVAEYQTRLLQQGIPVPAAKLIAQTVSQFERTQTEPPDTARQLVSHYRTQICQANLWRFQLLSGMSAQAMQSRLLEH